MKEGTIRRGTPARRPVAPQRRRPAPKGPTALDRLVAALPVGEETLAKIVTWTILAAVAAGALAIAAWVGVPAAAYTAASEAIGRLGYRVDQVEVMGLKRMDKNSIYAVALDQQTRAMPLVDLEEVRAKLLRYGWIADAHVSRRLPDTLLIQIEEREPAAVWQNAGRLMLIDATGVPLDTVALDRMPPLPLVIGDGANRQEPAYQRLMDAAPAMRPLVTAATWVGNRRWDLQFESGELLSLPEGEAAAAKALVKFAEIDGTQRLLGRGYLRFDLRDTSKLVARLPRGGAARAITGEDVTDEGGN